jgi:hypothetical protein
VGRIVFQVVLIVVSLPLAIAGFIASIVVPFGNNFVNAALYPFISIISTKYEVQVFRYFSQGGGAKKQPAKK